MSAVVYAYRPTPEARTRAHGAAAPIPREVHVHADGHAVACCDGHGDLHFASLFGLLDHYRLTQRDLESADPVGARPSSA
ncbi:MAG: hypothetical protein NVS3B10_09130 [Polyangiales bacterium]